MGLFDFLFRRRRQRPAITGLVQHVSPDRGVWIAPHGNYQILHLPPGTLRRMPQKLVAGDRVEYSLSAAGKPKHPSALPHGTPAMRSRTASERGTVKFYNPAREFGFIIPDG